MTKARPQSAPFQFQLDAASGVPFYRQVIDQILGAVASGRLGPNDQLPTVRQLAVDLAINPNTVMRAYRELEIRGILTTQQGTGTFITPKAIKPDDAERQRQLAQIVGEMLARAGAAGFTAGEVLERIEEFLAQQEKRRK